MTDNEQTTLEPPDRAWIKLLSNGELAAYRTDIQGKHFDGRPVYEFTRVSAASTAPVVDAKFTPPAEDALHVAICQAVQSDQFTASDILRQALMDYKPTQLTRTELIRIQQRSGTDHVTSIMVSPAAAPPAAPASDDYVAWLRYDFTNEETTGPTIHVCDSDAEGAFKVYRTPAAPQEDADSRTVCAACKHEFCKECYEVDECCKCDTDIPPRTVAERLAQHEHIEIVDGVLGGVNPLVSRRRISVHHVLSYLYNGENVESIAQDYQLTPEAIKDAIAFAQDVYDDAVATALRTSAAPTPSLPARDAAREIAQYLDAFTPLSPGTEMVRIFENTISRHLPAAETVGERGEQRYRDGVEDAARRECVFCEGVNGYNPIPVESETGDGYVHRNDPPHGLAGVYCRAPRTRALLNDKEGNNDA